MPSFGLCGFSLHTPTPQSHAAFGVSLPLWLAWLLHPIDSPSPLHRPAASSHHPSCPSLTPPSPHPHPIPHLPIPNLPISSSPHHPSCLAHTCPSQVDSLCQSPFHTQCKPHLSQVGLPKSIKLCIHLICAHFQQMMSLIPSLNTLVLAFRTKYRTHWAGTGFYRVQQVLIK